MKTSTVAALAAISFVSSVAAADGMPQASFDPNRKGDCDHTKRRPAKKRPAPPAKPVEVAPLPPCACQPGQDGPQGPKGDRGLRGPQGPKGDSGETKTVLIVRHVHDEPSGLQLRLGALGAVFGAHGGSHTADWLWGMGLQLTAPLSKGAELELAGGFAGPFDEAHWSPGRESGYLLHVGLASRGEFGLGLGLNYDRITGSPSNDFRSASYLSGDVAFVVHEKLGPLDIRGEVGPLVGGYRDDWFAPSHVVVGGEASLFAGYRW